MQIHEFHNAWRRLAARPGYSLLSVAVLGVGLGSVLFLLGLVNGLVLEPLPFPQAERLVAVGYANPRNIGIGGMSSTDFESLRPNLKSADTLGIYAGTTVDLVSGKGARHYDGCLLSESMLPLLGVQPILGRGFRPVDERFGAPLTVLISETVWRNDFGATPDIVGRPVRVNGEAATVIGVLPKAFTFPATSSVWLPARLHAAHEFDAEVIARLKSTTSLSQARAELKAVAGALGNELRGQRAGRDLIMKPLALRFVNETTRSYVWLMFAAGVLVLLLACANAANLQLGQALNRQRELAVCSALGASRSRLVGEQLAESFLLSLAATAVALVIAQSGAGWIEGIFAANGKAPPYFIHLGLDMRMLGFALIAALVTTALAGLVPAWRASRTDVQDALRDGAKGSRGGAFARIAKGLVVAEIALTVILLVGAGTFIHGLGRMLAVNLGSGADPTHILTARVALFPKQYPDAAGQARFFESVAQRLRAEPGVEAATVANTIPGAELGSHEFIAAEGASRPEGGYKRAQVGAVDDHFAQTYGIRLLSGRFFDARDKADGMPVAVVDRQLATTLWPDREPLGQHLVMHPEQENPETLTVIGTVGRLQLDGTTEASFPSLLVPLRQFPEPAAMLAIRSRGDAAAFAPRLAAVVASVDAETPVYAVRTQARAIDMGRISAIVLTQVFTAVGLIALLLAAAGLYGVLAFAVVQRTREIGIRRAIGASTGAIVGSVGRQLLFQVGLGLAIGIGLALPWSAALADPKMQTEAYEAAVFVTVVAVIVVVAITASLVPLYRALRIDPLLALRYE